MAAISLSIYCPHVFYPLRLRTVIGIAKLSSLSTIPLPVDLKTSSNIIKGLEISAKPQVKYFQTDGYIIKINLSRDKLRRRLESSIQY